MRKEFFLLFLLLFFAVNAFAKVDVRALGDDMKKSFEKNDRPSRLVMSGELSFKDAVYFYDSMRDHRDLLTTIIKSNKKINLFGLLVYLAGDNREIASDGIIVLSTKSAYANITKEDLTQYEDIVIERTNITREKLKELMASSEPITAEQAEKYGFALQIVD